MSTKVTPEERELIGELLTMHSPEHVALLTNRGIRTVYYIQAELRRNPVKETRPLLSRIIGFMKGETSAEEGINTRRVGENRRA